MLSYYVTIDILIGLFIVLNHGILDIVGLLIDEFPLAYARICLQGN
jgi:hypothetical protein